MSKKRFLHLVALSMLAVVLVACERQKIGDIKADPGSFHDKEVNVAGRVTQSFGVLGRGAYQVDDGTGSLWVVSETRGVPSKDAVVGVKGKIIPTLTFMGQNLATVLIENDRRALKESDI